MRACFCVWCVKCAKYLAFGTFSTPDGSALIPFKSKTEFEELTQANKEKLINDHRGNEGVKPYDLRKDILWKEISFLNKVTILKDVNKERTCRGHLTENSLDEHLTDDDKKKVK